MRSWNLFHLTRPTTPRSTNNKQCDLNLLAYYEIECLDDIDGPLHLIVQQVRFDSRLKSRGILND